MAFCHLLLCIGLFVASLYDVGLYILLLYLVIDIAVLGQFLMSINAGLLISSKFMALVKVVGASVIVILQGLALGHGFLASVFLFNRIDVSKGHSLNNFALFFICQYTVHLQ